VISVSTFSFKFLKPHIDLAILFCHSKENGFVTIQTVKAHNSFATSATTGAAHVHVPQPKPHVINIISAHSKEAFISSLDSSAAFCPISGSAQAQSPAVIIFQIFNFVGANELNRACVSVFIETNCTHSKPHSIILFTAFCHAHHTHTTFILATGEILFPIFTSSAD
jgi:hypothetical protein